MRKSKSSHGERIVKDIKRKTRKQYSAEEKIRDVLDSLRGELLNAECFASVNQAKTVIGRWLKQYNTVRPHQALGMRPPAPETLQSNGT